MSASRPILLIRKLARPFGTWAGFAGLYALTGGACPCCGQPACLNGLAVSGLIGGLAAAGLHFRRRPRQSDLSPNDLSPNDSGTTKERLTR